MPLIPFNVKYLGKYYGNWFILSNLIWIFCYLSFGMLLWELAFQRFPYKGLEISRIQEHVLKGGRESLNFPSSPYGVEKEFGNIIKAGMIDTYLY